MILSLLSRRLACVGMTAMGLTLALAGSANATLIDSFETQFNGLLGTGTGMAVAQAEVTGNGIIGGQREMVLSIEEGMGFASIIPGSAGTIVQLQGSTDVRTKLQLTYDGLMGLGIFNPQGLGGLALSGTSFLLRAMSTNPITATFRVFTDENNFSEGVFTTTPTGMLFETFSIAFTDFQAAGAQGGADFGNIGAIQIDLSVTGQATIGYDFIGTASDSLAVVPEPGSWALIGLGALGTIGYSQFRRRKARIAKAV